MRLHRFYINKTIGYERERITDERILHQWRDVFRYNVGTEVVLFDGSGMEFDCVIEKLTRIEAILRIFKERKASESPKKLVLCQSLIKKDKMEWVVEKATELGVSKIVPILSERSEKKGFNMERAKKIAIEAAEQSGRGTLPEILEPVDLTIALLREIKNREFEIALCDPSGSPLNKSEFVNPTSVFIGPEGGWTDKELNLFADEKTRIFSMGPLILRAETAAVSALSLLALQ